MCRLSSRSFNAGHYDLSLLATLEELADTTTCCYGPTFTAYSVPNREARKGNILDNKNDVPLHPGPLKEVPNHHPSIVEGGVKGRDLSANYMSKLWPYPPLYKKQVQHSQWELLNQNPSAPSCNYMHISFIIHPTIDLVVASFYVCGLISVFIVLLTPDPVTHLRLE
ncbi:hypothetical protein OUZ56_013516 [Daphnia magna]|uniref:Uncharacterized protein n=1 Tax=Daphnia magna TaxID=35525 RepID=A0ABQ9Z646_9CRUS|nr:hypothetical protein OUZ56_013516 [Daphnia magna]